MISKYETLTTETANSATSAIDSCDTLQMLTLINEQDQQVPNAVKMEIPHIAAAIELITECLKKNGRMIYVGAGTSGRLGVLDASECPPTFGTSPELVKAYIAGGDVALRTAAEGCEDDAVAGAQLIEQVGVGDNDVVIGITASGSAPFVIGAIEAASRKKAGTICVVNNQGSPLSALCDVAIEPIVGPEVIQGSTRMKAGTAQKMVLNMLTTGTMIRLGKVYGNLMVDLHVSNQKLYDRAVRIVQQTTKADNETAVRVLELADKNVKPAILMLKTGLDYEESEKLLEQHGGRLNETIEAATKS